MPYGLKPGSAAIARKLKGVASVRLNDGTIRLAEIHWFEAHGIGKRKMRIKQYLD
jgi:hypothetical protein